MINSHYQVSLTHKILLYCIHHMLFSHLFLDFNHTSIHNWIICSYWEISQNMYKREKELNYCRWKLLYRNIHQSNGNFCIFIWPGIISFCWKFFYAERWLSENHIFPLIWYLVAGTYACFLYQTELKVPKRFFGFCLCIRKKETKILWYFLNLKILNLKFKKLPPFFFVFS